MPHRIGSRTTIDGTVHLGTSMPIPGILRSLGEDPAQVLADVGLDLALFDDPDNLISYAMRGRLVALCVARTGCRHFGLLIGQQLGLHSLGLAGFLVRASANVGDALRSMERLLRLHVQGATLSLNVDGGNATIGYHSYQPNVEATDQSGDGALAGLFNVMKTLCGAAWAPLEVQFAHARPEDLKPFRQFFKAPLRFDAAQYALVFPAHWLKHASVSGDPELFRTLQRRVRDLPGGEDDDPPEQVRRVLRTALLTGHGKVGEVARLFSMHPRTLNRRLQDLDTSFQQLSDEIRFEIARQMLENSSLQISGIAASLGYARASAFTRAFRRWSGATPAAWRAQHRRATTAFNHE
jgi:AraC-like DNA-binding protein